MLIYCCKLGFLLIIGGDRNYLRRSRHVLAANESGQGSNGLDYNVTPREIMSFARQIASGMSYLSDIKVKRFFSFQFNEISISVILVGSPRFSS